MTEAGSGWKFCSNSDEVLVCIAGNRLARPCDIADRTDTTGRTAVGLPRDLEEAEILTRIREGRRNCYIINLEMYLRPPPESHSPVGELWSTNLGENQSQLAEHPA